MRTRLLATRRQFTQTTSLSALGWLAAQALGKAEANGTESSSKRGRHRCQAVILLWMNGGPSQLETFDPHPNSATGGPTKAIATNVKGVQFAEGLPQLAEWMDHLTVVRSMKTNEGEHERARYQMTTGYRPNPALIHPALGAVLASQLSLLAPDLPPYVAIMNQERISRAGYLGEQFSPFEFGDPMHRPANIHPSVSKDRQKRRLANLEVIEQAHARAVPSLEKRTYHRDQIGKALALMDSEQLKAFDINEEPVAVRQAYGETPFGRGCLAARRLVEAGVRCVEVQLGGWDSHAKNFSIHSSLNSTLDPAFAALLHDLKERDLLATTAVICAGEFGRTPKINGLEGRDHWPKWFSVAIAGGGFRPGYVHGETDPAGQDDPTDPVPVEDFFATLISACGLDPHEEFLTAIGRPMKWSEGKPVPKLLLPTT